jgi:hypothetical protein
MKNLFLLLFVGSISGLFGQEFSRGIYLGPWSSGIDYTILKDSLRLNTLEATIRTPSDEVFTQPFRFLIRELNLWEYSTGQKMIYEAEQAPLPLLKNYFDTTRGDIVGDFRRLRKNIDSLGYMVKDAVPDSEYHFLEYGRKWYTAKFIMKMDSGGSNATATTPIANLIIYSKTLGANDTLRTLLVNNFAANNTVYTFELRFKVDSVTPPPSTPKKWDRLTGGAQSVTLYQEKIDLRVYWHGNVTLYLDKVIVEDDTAKTLFAGGADARIAAAASPFTSSTKLKRFYLFDEPPVSSLLGVDYVDKHLQNTAGLQDTGITATFWKDSQLDRFVADANPAEILMDFYAINPYVPYPGLSDGEATSLGITNYGAWTYKRNLHERLSLLLDSALSSVALKAKSSSRPFWYVPQLNGLYKRETGTYYALRPPTTNEINATVGLGLAFGAKGIMGWLFRTYGDGSYIYVGLVDSLYNYTTNYLTAGGSFFGGFNNTYRGYKRAMGKLDTLATTLAGLEWQGLKRWFYADHDTTYGSWNGLLSNIITKNVSGVEDSSGQKYVSTGHLKGTGSSDYFLVVNRRCDANDTRNIIITLNTPTQWKVTDVCAADTTTTDEQGSFTKQFAPGDWKLLKIVEQGPTVPTNFSSNSSGFVHLTWTASTGQNIIYEIERDLNDSGWELLGTTSSTWYYDIEFKIGSGWNTASYRVRAKSTSQNLHSSWTNVISLGGRYYPSKKIGTGTAELLPTENILFQNSPNPFNPTTTIRYGLTEPRYVTIKIYNSIGQQVEVLDEGFSNAGYRERQYDASRLASGPYYYTITAGTFIETKKMLVVK